MKLELKKNDNILDGFYGLICQIYLDHGFYWVCSFFLKNISS